ncbi:hypothetical protein PFNF54_03921 [Plasmodium falciparum NF54]|uniref:Erythrocyte membrane protein 1 n=1 Tax=Plasmodium falciparum (isolate NF54) TaxID=5843 RepID=W7K2Z2_PLAFO|nr:hypothetical protein PFNF54_03921 [Plasmodium falciparum NF54]
MAPGSGGAASSGEEDKDAKHVLDEFGQKVHDEVKKEAKKYIDELKAGVSFASILGEESAHTTEPCGLDYSKLIKGSGSGGVAARGHPCGNGSASASDKRFSKERVDEYDEKKIGCSNSEGACAPYRRLHLCNKNFPNMNSKDSSKAKHDLLVDVCMAAKYEGESLKVYHEQYEVQYPSSGSTMCTELARSFADIGDIVRGIDLYGGNNKRRKQLDDKLKEIFKKIHENLGTHEKKHYENDTANYYKLREAWWALNRQDVWKALTCDAHGTYFRATCSERNGGCSQANDKCRCPKTSDGKANDQVPTYFDYVPQYLRWFEEWAEDFCRKKNKKVENVKKQCRKKDNSSDDRYCSRNGYDCEKTKRAIGKLRYGKGCTECFFACNPYVEWIEKQKEQFDKQKKKYDEEIKKYENGAPRSSGGRAKRAAPSNINYEGYESKFYKILKGDYGSVDAFLEKLSKENVCTAITDGGRISFEKVNTGSTGGSVRDASGGDSGTNNEKEGTFYRSEYCQPCPYCGVKKKNGNEWKKKDTDQCKNIKLYKPRDDKGGTPIEILKSGEKHDDIETKLKAFCKTQNGSDGGRGGSGGSGGKNSDSSLYDPWQCYQIGELTKDNKAGGEDDEDDDDYDGLVTNSGGLCILKNNINKKEKPERSSQKEPDEIQKTFHDFFYYWVAHMLKDSIHWRTKKLDKCLQNGNKKCGKKICNGDCECFKRWVEQKETEWGKIKEHFKTQKGFDKEDNSSPSGFTLRMTHDVVLDGVLKEEFLKGDSEDGSAQDTQNSLDAEEIQHLREMLKETGFDGGSGIGVAKEQKTLMDKLIEYEKGIATKCLQKCQETQPENPARSLDSVPGSPSPPADPSLDTARGPNHEEEEEDDDSGDDDEVDLQEDQEDQDEAEAEDPDGESSTAETTQQEAVAPTTQDNAEKPCDIVDKLFQNPEQFKEVACKQKYAKNNSRLGWKCVTPSGDQKATSEGNGDANRRVARQTSESGEKSGDKDGAICIPPRRRRLYIQKLQEWAKTVGNTVVSGEPQTQGEASSPSDKESSQSDKLREAFIQSAAIETFFLWDRYKKEWALQKLAELQRNGDLPFFTSGAGYGMTAVVNGAQPTASPGHSNGLISLPSLVTDSDNPQNKLNDGTIPPDFLRQMFYTLGDYRDICIGVKEDVIKALKASSDKNIETIKKAIDEILSKQSRNNQQSGQKSGTTPQTWWDENAQHIWEGMVCALTYEDNGEKKIEKVNDANGTDLFEKLKTKYQYKNVKLDENSGTEAKTNEPSSPSSDNTPTTLTDFISRPTYFRYLEEWGQNFCKERKKRLEKIKEDCYRNGGRGEKQYSGDGEDCTQMLPADPTTLPALGYSCPKSCSSYRKWIERKKDEFTEQQNAFTKQKASAQKNNDDNGFCETLENYEEAKHFLQKLVPCSKTNNESGEGPIKFDDQDETFRPAKNCAPCSEFKVKCNGRVCTGGVTKGNCNGGRITAENIQNKRDGNGNIHMRVIDSNTAVFNGLDEACKTSGIFKGIRKEQWKCDNVCGYEVCKPENGNENENKNQILLFNALFKRWLEYFLEDYKKIKHKISHCMKNGNGSKCTNDCPNKCKCVEKWVEKKREEWYIVKKRFNGQYTKENDDAISSNLNSFLEPLVTQIAAATDKAEHETLEKLEKSLGCNCPDSSQKKGDTPKDIVECLLNKLQQKATSCQEQHSDVDPKTSCETSSPVEDEDDTLDEETEVKAPEICKNVVDTKKENDETGETCTSEDTITKETVETDSTDGPKQEEPPAATRPTKPKGRKPRQPKEIDFPTPALKNAMLSSTIMWSIGIGFATFTYFFLKKKTKASVGNLFQILQIPKGDYDISTLKSSNRYIPYASDRYKGKTYIYMEGDSSGDEKYAFMSDTTDVTSSESEYEELDINDIYVPGSPKYKTLIEVVLEPSKRDTQNDIHNDIPSDIPNSDTPPPITDDEWNKLKKDFISNMLQNTQNTEPNILRDNVDNNTHPTTSHHNVEEKPFIMSIHDRNLFSGEEISYNVNMVNSMNDIPMSGKNDVYSGIDLINDSLNSDQHIDIYDEVLKRKENELFGTNNTKKNTSTNSASKLTNSDPITNQLELFHKWLDRHRHMCDQWNKNKKEELLDELKEEWNKENNNSSAKTYNSDNKPSHNHVLNTDVSIQIDMDNLKPKNEFTNMDTINKNFVDKNNQNQHPIEKPTKIQIEMNINNGELVKEKYPISDIWNI